MKDDNHISDVAAMRTLLAGLMMTVHRYKYQSGKPEKVAEMAIADADALIDALSKPKAQPKPQFKSKKK